MEAPTGDLSEHTFRFPSDSDAAFAARQALRDLRPAVPPHVMSDLMLCVTELVTNSVQHPAGADGGDVEMAVRVSGDAVHIEVGDRGEGFDEGAGVRIARERGERGGWGLYIVELLADRWGVERRDLNWVWFEIDYGGSGARR